MPGYTVENKDGTCRVSLAGDLTAALVPALQQELKAAVAGGATGVIFDLGGTVMLDSSGIGLLMAATNSLRAKGGRVRVVNVSADIFRLLQSMRLTARLDVSVRAGEDS